jgi:GABA(A) receptor-associated protein
MTGFVFKTKHSLSERLDETTRILVKYPDRIPIICEKNPKSKETPEIDKNKYLVPYDLSVGQFMYVVRKRLALPPEKALFFFIGGTIPSSSSLLNNIYYQSKDEDGFLYIQYSLENTFGKFI